MKWLEHLFKLWVQYVAVGCVTIPLVMIYFLLATLGLGGRLLFIVLLIAGVYLASKVWNWAGRLL